MSPGPGLPQGYEFDRRLDLDVVHGWITGSYWGKGRSREAVRASFEGSDYIAIFTSGDHGPGPQAAVARLVTDGVTFGWLCDVFVDPAHRGRGLARAMLVRLLSTGRAAELDRIGLATRDAQSLYASLGFVGVDGDNPFMELRRDRPRTSA